MVTIVCKNCKKKLCSRQCVFCSRQCYWNSLIGTKLSKSTKDKMKKSAKRGIPRSSDVKRKISLSKVGHIGWNKGGKRTEEVRMKISVAHRKIPLELFDGFITEKNKAERRRFVHTIQKQVFKRDKGICVLCSSNKDLQVDHIQKWSEYPEERFNIDNCRTLCQKCHYKITFGKDMPKESKSWGHNLLGRIGITK